MSAGHTPTPWSFDGPASSIIVWGPDPDIRVCFMTSDGPAKENAALIVRAVNAHDDLVEALRKAESAINAAFFQVDAENRGHDRKADQYDLIVREGRDAIRAALSKALGTDRAGEE